MADDKATVAREESAKAERALRLAGYQVLQSGMAVELAPQLPGNVVSAMLSVLSDSGPQKFPRKCCCCGRAIAQTDRVRFGKGSGFGGVGAVNVCVRGKRGTQGTVKDGCFEQLQRALATRALAGLNLTLQGV